jgi:hypothetical protein
MPRSHTESKFDVVHMCMEDKLSNATGSTSLSDPSQQESSKQMDVQNLSRCRAAVFWAVGLCIVLEPIKGASRDLARP